MSRLDATVCPKLSIFLKNDDVINYDVIINATILIVSFNLFYCYATTVQIWSL